MNISFKNIKSIKYRCRYNIIFCVKYKRKFLVDEVAKKLIDTVRNTCVAINADLISVECFEYYVHIVVNINPRSSVHRFVSRIKLDTYKLRLEFAHLRRILPCMWTSAYLVTTQKSVSARALAQFLDSEPERVY